MVSLLMSSQFKQFGQAIAKFNVIVDILLAHEMEEEMKVI